MNTLLPRDLISEQRQALIEALKRYGYTHVDAATRDEDGCLQMLVHPSEIKPYGVVIDYEALVVLHRTCTGCVDLSSYREYLEHDADFLIAMIPIIGRLDARSSLDLCEGLGWAPRLWIRL